MKTIIKYEDSLPCLEKALISARESGYLQEEIKESFSTSGFSFVVDFELTLPN